MVDLDVNFPVIYVAGEWGEWNSFSSCSHNSGGGFRTRTRECEGPGECFPGKSFQYQDCKNQNCCHT